jgi:hypothetical protein
MYNLQAKIVGARVAAKYERERALVELLMHRRGLMAESFIDPNQEAGHETGADVIAVVGGHRIGVQVTELDTGDVPGQARASEKASWNEAQEGGQRPYAGWAQNDPSKLVSAVARAIASKVQQIVGCDEAWLLVSASLPELGTLVSTFVITQWLPANALDAATISHLAKCKYTQAFLHVIVGSEDALYWWRAGGNWQKQARREQIDVSANSFFALRDNPSELQEWMADLEGKTVREVERVRREFRGLRGQGKPLPSFLQLDGQWIVEGLMFLYHSESEDASAGTFTRQAERHDGQLCIGFNAAQVAAALGVPAEALMEANRNQTLVPLGTASVQPEHGGVSATAYGFGIGEKQGYVTVEQYNEGRA